MKKSFLEKSVKENNFRFTEHATLQRLARDITVDDIKHALRNGEIIERNPHSAPYPSCLVLGWLKTGDPLHVKCSEGPHGPKLRIVTVYEPSDAEWEQDFKTRKARR